MIKHIIYTCAKVQNTKIGQTQFVLDQTEINIFMQLLALEIKIALLYPKWPKLDMIPLLYKINIEVATALATVKTEKKAETKSHQWNSKCT